MSATINKGWQRNITAVRASRRVQIPSLTISDAEDQAFARAFQSLSLHRQQLLRLVAEGRTGQEVADCLFITHTTVKNTLTMIYTQLGVTSPHRAKRACYLLGRYDQWALCADAGSEEREGKASKRAIGA